MPRWVLPPQPDMLVLPETAVDYTLYGDSVYVIREDGKDAKGDPILKAVRTPVKTGARWGNKRNDPRWAQTGRPRRRGRSGQGPERRAGRDQRFAATTARRKTLTRN